MSASAAEDQPASVAARRTCSPAPARPARRPTPPPVAPPQRPARRRPRSAARPAGWASLTSARQDPAHATPQRRRHGAIIGARSPGVTAMGGDTKSGRDGNGGGSERSAGGGEGGPGAPRGRSLADPLFGAGRRARRRGPNSLTRADGAGVAAGRHRARTGTARAGTRVPAAPSRRWSPGRHRIGIHSVATPIDQLRADPPSRPWSVTAGSARAGARRGPPWTVLGADNPSTSSPRIGLARKDGRRLGRLTVRERRERSGSSSPAFTGIVHAEGSIHSWANQLRTNDDAPIRDGEHPPSFRSLASAQVSYIRCFFGAYYREPDNRVAPTRGPRTHLPRAARRARPDRVHQPGQRRGPLHLLRQARLPLPGRPTTTPRPPLPVQPRHRRQDREPPAHRTRRRALPRLDHQPASPRTDRRPAGADLSRRRRPPPTPTTDPEPTPNRETLTDHDKWGVKRSPRSAERQHVGSTSPQFPGAYAAASSTAPTCWQTKSGRP